MEVLGKLIFNDVKNKIKAEFSFDNVNRCNSNFRFVGNRVIISPAI